MRLILHKDPGVARDDKGRPQIYAWPGGYPVFHVTGDCEALCPACARERETHHAGDCKPSKASLPTQSDVNWEDPDLYCDGCGERIESAYAEDEEDEDERSAA